MANWEGLSVFKHVTHQQGFEKVCDGEEHYPSALCPEWHCVYVTTTTLHCPGPGQIPLRVEESEILNSIKNSQFTSFSFLSNVFSVAIAT